MTADRTDQALSFRGVGPPKIDIEDEKDDFLQESAYLQVPCETSGVYDILYWLVHNPRNDVRNNPQRAE